MARPRGDHDADRSDHDGAIKIEEAGEDVVLDQAVLATRDLAQGGRGPRSISPRGAARSLVQHGQSIVRVRSTASMPEPRAGRCVMSPAKARELVHAVGVLEPLSVWLLGQPMPERGSYMGAGKKSNEIMFFGWQ